MLFIETDRLVVYDNQDFKVSEGGEFMETDLIPIYLASDPEKKPIYALQAYWILNHINFGEE